MVNVRKKKNIQTEPCRPSGLLSDLQLNSREGSDSVASSKTLSNSSKFLNTRADLSIKAGYSKQKWILFCEALLADGYNLYLYEARETFSKYITIVSGDRDYLVRFSNHKPNRSREMNGDCDFFVGWTHTGIRTTDDALVAVREFFNA